MLMKVSKCSKVFLVISGRKSSLCPIRPSLVRSSGIKIGIKMILGMEWDRMRRNCYYHFTGAIFKTYEMDFDVKKIFILLIIPLFVIY